MPYLEEHLYKFFAPSSFIFLLFATKLWFTLNVSILQLLRQRTIYVGLLTNCYNTKNIFFFSVNLKEQRENWVKGGKGEYQIGNRKWRSKEEREERGI